METNSQPIKDLVERSSFIKLEAGKLGFDACGIAPAHPLPVETRKHYRQWLKQGYQGDMYYMERNLEIRLDPTKLVQGATSVIVVALNYDTLQPTSMPKIAKYARRPDYHPFIRERLHALLERIRETGVEVTGRAFSDSAPLSERYWAEQAGLGWVGRNNLLILPGKGSWHLLGALVITLPLSYDKPAKNRCGTCRRCIDACPSQALDTEKGFDARRCLSYLTIEKRGDFDPSQTALLEGNDSFFGCDRCQDSCPWNRFSGEATNPNYPLLPFLVNLDTNKLGQMDTDTFKGTFRGTSLERSGLDALVRNLKAIKKVRPFE